MSAKLSIKKEISVQKKKTSTKSSVIGGGGDDVADDDKRSRDDRNHTKVGSIKKRQTKTKKELKTNKTQKEQHSFEECIASTPVGNIPLAVVRPNSKLGRTEDEDSDAKVHTSHKAEKRRSPRKTTSAMKNAPPKISLKTKVDNDANDIDYDDESKASSSSKTKKLTRLYLHRNQGKYQLNPYLLATGMTVIMVTTAVINDSNDGNFVSDTMC